MALVTASPRPDPTRPDTAVDEPDLRLSWTRGLSLTNRILAVNGLALALLAGGFFYLDSFRVRLLDSRTDEVVAQTRLAGEALATVTPGARPALLAKLGATSGLRLRLYTGAIGPPVDSWAFGPATYRLRDPAREPWVREAARALDRVVGWVAGARPLPPFAEPRPDRARAWPEVRGAAQRRAPTVAVRQAPDLTPVVSAAVPVAGGVLLGTANARDVTRTVRDERLRLGLVLLAVLLVSVLLSLFLARTIVRPLRRLAIAAQRVRLGRAREVRVPRLPSRRDEIGALARALSDMTGALRQRIDNTEAFAADVTHELKNPLASLRSAVEGLERVEEPALRAQLLAVVRDDVTRLDRLVVDIAETARLDAELSRARFETIDVGALVKPLVPAWVARGAERGVRLAWARPRARATVVAGEPARLGRALGNLVDNALSFSPPGGLVEVGATRVGGDVQVHVEDEGPGVPPDARGRIFERFHTDRPEEDAFGRHSGLGLSIARAIVEGHGGTIEVGERGDRRRGARFTVRLPAVDG